MQRLWSVFGLVSLIMLIGLAAITGRAATVVRAQGTCTELVQNGGFETDVAWLLGTAPQMPEYVTYTYHGGRRSLALGITKGASQKSYSSARQTVVIPPTAATVTLSFWFNAMVNDPLHDQHMALVLLAPNGAVLDQPWRSRNDSRIWNQLSFDLTRWRGRTVQIYFNVYNDGRGGTAGMFLDDVSLVACSIPPATPTAAATPSPTRTPTATIPVWTMTFTPYYVTPTRTPTPPTATPTATRAFWTPTSPPATHTPIIATVIPTPVTPGPGNCLDLAKNGGFDQGLSGWHPAINVLPAQLVGSPTHSPPYALQLGTQSQQARSYSSVRQYLHLPAATRATLQFWTWTWAEPNAGADRQEALLLAADNSVLAVLWRVLVNEQGWRQVRADLSPYAGRTVAIYFNVANDGTGGRTALFLDDVQVLVCSEPTGTPIPITVLPPLILGDERALPELPEGAEMAPDRTNGVGINPEPVMTRVALEGFASATPTSIAATTTPSPAPSPVPTAAPSRSPLEEWAEQVSVLGCVAGLFLFALIAVLLIWGILVPWIERQRGQGRP